jgi:hypothetical protein
MCNGLAEERGSIEIQLVEDFTALPPFHRIASHFILNRNTVVAVS